MSRVLVVALNPALDITHELARVDWAGVNRPAVVLERPGGKGLNVARTLRALGADVLVTGLAGGRTGDAVRSALAGTGVPARFTPIAGETRRTFAVVDAGRGQTARWAATSSAGTAILTASCLRQSTLHQSSGGAAAGRRLGAMLLRSD